MAEAGTTYLPLDARPMKDTICIFDLDGTLCPEKQVCTHVTIPNPSSPEFASSMLITLQHV